MKKQFSGIIGLFAIAFLIGAALTLTIASPAAACQQGNCHNEFDSCPAGTPCEGQPCLLNWDGYTGSSPRVCCGSITWYWCL